MKTRSFIVAIAALSFATAALATGAAADYVTLSNKYASSQLESICARNDGSFYRAARGTYGCVAGGNVVECSNAGACTGFTQTPFALLGTGSSNHRELGAETVLQTPAPPTEELTSGTASGLLLMSQ